MLTTAEKNAPMFKTVGQALSVAFSVADTDPTVKGTMEGALKDLAEKRYGAAPVLQSERTINRDGLKEGEFRAQCVMIVDMVDTKLAGQERDTIFARHTKVTMKRATAVRNLRDHFLSLCNTQSKDAVLALLWAIYAPFAQQRAAETPQEFNARRKQREKEWSIRTIEKDYSVAKSVLHRDQQMLRKLLSGVELQAEAKIEAVLLKAGLLGEPEED